MTRFIVLSTQRSGSSYLCSLLDKHPSITCLRELFRPGAKHAITYRRYRRSSIPRVIRHVLDSRGSIDRYLSGIYGPPQPAEALGFKLMYGQVRRYPEVVDWCRHNEVRVVHLIRRNSLKVIVSRQIAAERGIYWSTRPVETRKVNLKTRALVARLRESNTLVEKHRALFSSLPYMEVVYEDFVADRDAELRRILEFLGCDVNVQLTSELVKTSPDALDLLIENYEDVRRTLLGTPFEGHLG